MARSNTNPPDLLDAVRGYLDESCWTPERSVDMARAFLFEAPSLVIDIRQFVSGKPLEAVIWSDVNEDDIEAALDKAGGLLPIALIPEPWNSVDPCAVQIEVEGMGFVGYLARSEPLQEAVSAFLRLDREGWATGYLALMPRKLQGARFHYWAAFVRRRTVFDDGSDVKALIEAASIEVSEQTLDDLAPDTGAKCAVDPGL